MNNPGERPEAVPAPEPALAPAPPAGDAAVPGAAGVAAVAADAEPEPQPEHAPEPEALPALCLKKFVIGRTRNANKDETKPEDRFIFRPTDDDVLTRDDYQTPDGTAEVDLPERSPTLLRQCLQHFHKLWGGTQVRCKIGRTAYYGDVSALCEGKTYAPGTARNPCYVRFRYRKGDATHDMGRFQGDVGRVIVLAEIGRRPGVRDEDFRNWLNDRENALRGALATEMKTCLCPRPKCSTACGQDCVQQCVDHFCKMWGSADGNFSTDGGKCGDYNTGILYIAATTVPSVPATAPGGAGSGDDDDAGSGDDDDEDSGGKGNIIVENYHGKAGGGAGADSHDPE